MSGKVVVITGANTGIGYVTAREIAKLNGHVIVTCRTDDKGKATVAKIKEEVGDHANVEFMPLELSSLKSVRDFAAAFRAKKLPLHVLINNAGIMNTPHGLTEDGFEQQLAVNHTAHFLLTLSLLDIIKASAPSKIINVSSAAHKWATVDFDDVNLEKGYNGWKAYGRSKLANILFSNELADRLEGTKVTVNSLMPGFVKTDLARNSGWMMGTVFSALHMAGIQIGVDEGAKTTLKLATDPSTDGITGKYWEKCAVSTPNQHAQDRDLGKKLWDLSLKWTGIKVDPTASKSK
eukprot:TRINITY_DN10174_c0_g1_i1.p1 TRINITY_DN10174_c0_g1~~TRINITY_DN10174_c0_g1_i1.p1  ORF type:complete len:292 (-),score=65.23 TRINITY_DN10174_c0_g1_i1:1028-1903(-)